MTSLVLMYVFYDKNGDIKAITPSLDESFAITFSVATFPLSEVEGFLLAQKNTFEYKVKEVEKLAGITYRLVKKYTGVNYTRTLDSYLTKVETTKNTYNTIVIVNDTVNKHFSIQIAREFKEIYKHGSEEEQERVSDFLNKGPSIVYITKRNNPYHLLFSFVWTPKALFDAERLYFNYTGNYNDVSAYTKKLITGYEYKEKVV